MLLTRTKEEEEVGGRRENGNIPRGAISTSEEREREGLAVEPGPKSAIDLTPLDEMLTFPT